MIPRIGFTIWRKDLGRIKELINELVSLSFDHVEIDIDTLLELEDTKWLRNFVELLEENNLTFGIHGPWKEIYLASPQEEIREAALRVIERLIHRLQDFSNYKYIVLHPSSENPVCQEDPRVCLNALVNSLNRLLEIDNRIVIETIQGKCCGQLNHLEILLDKIPDLRICIDLAHIYTENMKLKQFKKLSDVFEIVPKKILRNTLLLHLHGVQADSGKTRSHRDFSYTPLGEENIFLTTREYTNIKYLVFEVFYSREGKSSWPRDVGDEIKRLRDLYKGS